jgi:hypothetical protein
MMSWFSKKNYIRRINQNKIKIKALFFTQFLSAKKDVLSQVWGWAGSTSAKTDI